MRPTNVADWTLEDYERAAEEYCASLPLEHFMEAIGQSTQRKISWESLDLIALRRGNMQVFNELLVQYPRNGGLGQVVPDNMVRRGKRKLKTGGSYNIAFEVIKPFWVLEYVSKSNRRKDYEDNLIKYQDDLKVPYYLLFEPERQELRLYRHDGTVYHRVEPNQHGRLTVRELDIEVALLDGWARFWYQGKLVPLPEDLQQEVDKLLKQLDQTREQVVRQKRRADRQKRRAEQEQHRAEEEKHRAEEEKHRADEAQRRAQAAEEEVKRLKALLEQQTARPTKRNGNGK